MRYIALGTGLQWNQTGVRVAGTGNDETDSSGFKKASWLYVNANSTLYISDQQNNRVQMCTSNATSGVTVAGSSTDVQGTSSTLLQQPFAVTFDNNGFMYVSDQKNNRVQQFPPNSLNSTTVAGQADGSTPNGLSSIKNPSGIVVDNNLNIYIADIGNKQIVVWAPNTTNGSIFIANNLFDQVYGLLLVPGSSNQLYISCPNHHSIYLWAFNASNANVTLTQVSGTPNNLGNPSGIVLDPYGNLYVADNGNNRVVMYCFNSTNTTVGNTVVGSTNQPLAVGFDSNLNMYVLTDNGDSVVRYALL